MFDPLVSKRVRVSDHSDEFLVRSGHHATHIADISYRNGPAATESGAPLEPPLAAGEDAPARDGSSRRENPWLPATLSRLRMSNAQLRQSSILLTDLKNLLSTTMTAIRTSQQLIAASDKLIERARTLGCVEKRDRENS